MATWFPGQVLGLNLCSQCHKDEMVSMFFGYKWDFVILYFLYFLNIYFYTYTINQCINYTDLY